MQQACWSERVPVARTSCCLTGNCLDFNGEDSLAVLRRHCPRLAVSALSGRPEAYQAALHAWVDAFVSKGDPLDRLLAAIAAVSQAHTWPDGQHSANRSSEK
jgi:hypothetical protein